MDSLRLVAIALAALPASCAAIAGLDGEFVVGDDLVGGSAGSAVTTGGDGAGGEATTTGSTATTVTDSGGSGGGGSDGGSGGTGSGIGAGGAGGSGGATYGSCLEVLNSGQSTGSHAYAVSTPSGPQQLYCDLDVDGGGWTLVGQVSGKFDNYDSWLRTDVAPANLASAAIESGVYSCIDAVPMAVQRASEIRLSNSAIDRWVKWTLAPGRTLATWWNHGAGFATIEAAADSPVTVHAYDGGTSSCFQNVYGIMPWELHGGSYPTAPRNEPGNTSPGDWCMAVGVMLAGSTAHGFSQNNNGWDAPSTEAAWPNGDYNSPPIVSVWLR